MILLAASLLFTTPLPLDMPQAEGYLVREKGIYRLEDRFNKLDLWVSQSVDGRWMDEDGRVFMLAHLDVLPPEGDAARSVATRADYARGRVKIDKRDKYAVRTALATLSPVELPEKETRPRYLPRGFKDVDYWQGTNQSIIVCAYLPEKADVWRLAIWQLVEDDDFDDSLKAFEEELFAPTDDSNIRTSEHSNISYPSFSERELLRADARHAVSAYPDWHVTDAEEFSILDALPSSRDFIVTLTNDLSIMRRKYAETLPTTIDGSNTLCVARIYADREDYLMALELSGLTNMEWSAAYWCPSRRELVAHGDSPQLLGTIRHEAFHQYLSYATSMLPVSPWLNEGYAEYFEGEDWKTEKVQWDSLLNLKPTAEALESYAALLPGLLVMDYDAFYAGTDEARRLKYKLAWSIAVFLEKGAPKVRFRPFEDLKRDYIKALFETKDMVQATTIAFKDKERIEKFVAEWLKFWKEH